MERCLRSTQIQAYFVDTSNKVKFKECPVSFSKIRYKSTSAKTVSAKMTIVIPLFCLPTT